MTRANERLHLYTKMPAINLFDYVNSRFEHHVAAAEVLGCMTATIRSWKEPGKQIKVIFADRFACRLGVHPCVIWPELWFEESQAQEEASCRKSAKQRQKRKMLSLTSSQ